MSKFSLTALGAALAAGVALTSIALPAAAADREQVVIGFKAGKAAAVRAALAKAGAITVTDLSEVNAVAVKLRPAMIAALKKRADITFIEPDYEMKMLGKASSKAAAVSPVPLAETAPYGIAMVQADMVSDSAAGNRTLCIIDSGYDIAHEDLSSMNVSGENLTTSGDWNTDEAQHGTHVAGTIAALGGNGVGVVGVLPSGNINLYIAKVFDASGTTRSSTVAKAGLACWRAGANVVSMSLGGDSNNRLQEIVFNFLAKRNVLNIAAAGNLGDTTVSYPAGLDSVMSVAAVDSNKAHADFSQFNSTVEIAGPGVAVLSTVPMGTALVSDTTVGGVSYESLGMEGSPVTSATAALYDFGTGEVDDAGVAGKVCLIQRGNISFADKVLRCQNNGGVAAIVYNNEAGILAGTLGTTVTTIPSVGVSDVDGAAMLGQLGQSATVAISAGNYAYFNGTSMATPHVSAVAALVWSQHPECSAAEIRSTLNLSAEDLGAAGRDVEFGYGLVQAKAATDRIAANGCGL